MYYWCGPKDGSEGFLFKAFRRSIFSKMCALIIWNFVRDIENACVLKIKRKEREKSSNEEKSYQRIFQLKFTCRKQRATEIKHNRTGNTLAKIRDKKDKQGFAFLVWLSIFWLYTNQHLEESNIHPFTHHHRACEYTEKSTSLYLLREQISQKGKKMETYQKKINWWCLKMYLCIC